MNSQPLRIVPRTFTEMGTLETEGAFQAKPLEAYFDCSAIVVLGDAGGGKTTSFEQAAIQEKGAYASVRDFITFTPERWAGKILYLDGLDEERSKTIQGSPVLDEIRKRLSQLGRPRFRLSCRAADWYGGLDQRNLEAVSGDNRVTVLRLNVLSETDIVSIVENRVPDIAHFIEEARNRGIFDLLINPQNLELILRVVGDGDWPETKAELYRLATELMASEVNEEHARSASGKINTKDIVHAAGALCTYHLLGNTVGIALSQLAEDDAFPWIGRFPLPTERLEAAAGRRLFRFVSSERVQPIHRTVAEYLGANYLKGLVKKGLPIGRVMALISGHDGGTVSNLRGLFAWLISLLPEYAEPLLHRDPLGIILYGDVSVLGKPLKLNLLEALGALANRDPWFRSENWAREPFGALGSRDMADSLRRVLEDPAQPRAVVGCVLDAICHGCPLPELGDLLLSMIRDNVRPEYIREHALHAFLHASQERRDELLHLLDEVNDGNVKDPNNQLRGTLLSELYLREITPSQVLKYLIPGQSNFIGRYAAFLRHNLPDLTPEEGLPDLLDQVWAGELRGDWHDSLGRKRFVGKLLVRALSLFGDKVSTERLYHWLGCSVNERKARRRREYLDRGEQKEIKKWLEEHPDVVMELYRYFLETRPRKNLLFEHHCFWEQLLHPNRPHGFVRWLLNLAKKEKEQRLSEFLFQEGMTLSFVEGRSDVPTLDELHAFVEAHPRFKAVFRNMTFCKIPDWRMENAKRELAELKKKDAWRSQNTTALLKKTSQIRSGQAIPELDLFAMILFARFVDVDDNLVGPDRIASVLSQDLVVPAIEGFVASLNHPNLPSPHEIGKLRCRAKRFLLHLPVLAGMDTLAQQDMDALFGLSPRILRSALAFHFASSEDYESDWPSSIVAAMPDLAAETLEEFWKPFLTKKVEHIPGFYDVMREEDMVPLAKRLSLKLLSRFSLCHERHLQELMLFSLKHNDRAALLSLAEQVLENHHKTRGAKRVLWMTTAFLVAPEKWEHRLFAYLSRSDEKVLQCVDYLSALSENDRGFPISTLPDSAIVILVRLLGKAFKPYSLHRTGVSDDWHASKMLSHLIELLSSRSGREVRDLLNRLLRDRNLVSWRDEIAHNLQEHLKSQRESSFRYPSVEQVIETLKSGNPANLADLHAIVCEHLHEIRQNIERGSADSYKVFWNVDRHGRPTEARPENDGRDRLLERLRLALRPLGIDAEREGDYRDHKRSDIKILFRQMNIPVEIKRHCHRDVWTALTDQLLEKYTTDLGCEGWGVYAVLWYGLDFGKVAKPPQAIKAPTTPEALRDALTRMIPQEKQHQIEVMCIDCSRSHQ